MKKIIFYLLPWLIGTFLLNTACSGNNEPEPPGPPTPPTPKTIKIMPIGDSLTEANEPGYRGYLYNQLKEEGLDIDFVGVKESMPSNGGDPDHSGFGGFVIGPGASAGDEWSSSLGKGNIYYHLDNGHEILSKNCSVILLMIGINDFFNNKEEGYDPAKDGAVKLEALVEKIYTIMPDVTLLVANLAPVAWDMKNFGKLFCEQVPEIVNRQKNKERPCYFVDVRNDHEWIASADISDDQLHLTAEGYKKVAASFYKVLYPILTDN